MADRALPTVCPSCRGLLKVGRLCCPGCGTTVEGEFDLPILARLEVEEQAFVVNLVRANGRLKDLARVYGVSYPTVRNRLDAVIEKVKSLESAVAQQKES